MWSTLDGWLVVGGGEHKARVEVKGRLGTVCIVSTALVVELWCRAVSLWDQYRRQSRSDKGWRIISLVTSGANLD